MKHPWWQTEGEEIEMSQQSEGREHIVSVRKTLECGIGLRYRNDDVFPDLFV